MKHCLILSLLLCLTLSLLAQTLSKADSAILASLPPDSLLIVDKEPVPLNIDEVKRMIGYPQIARDAGMQGEVIVRVLVNSEGNYVTHKVVQYAPQLLVNSVEQQLHHLQFSPAIYKGQGMPFWVNIPFRFKLLGGPGGPVQNPEVVYKARYPVEALEKGITGLVVVKGKPNGGGKLVKYQVVRADHPVLQEKAESLLRQIRFTRRGYLHRAILFTFSFEIFDGEQKTGAIMYRM